MAEFALTVIGSGSALPMHGRHPSAQIIQYDDFFCLIDCGESTQMRLRTSGIRPFKINCVLISHLHGDHVFGLPGLLSSFSHLQRKDPLTVYGPAGIKGLLEQILFYTELKINYPLTIIENTPVQSQLLFQKDNIEVLTFPLDHRIPCNGYMIREISGVVHLRKEVIEPLRLAPEQIRAVQRGEDIFHHGKKYDNASLTHGMARQIGYAYCSDTRFDERIIPWIEGVPVLYHETTFGDELAAMASHTGHSTASEAARIAKAAGASCLITGHYSSRYKEVDTLIRQCMEHFPNVLEAVEGKKYNLRALAGEQT